MRTESRSGSAEIIVPSVFRMDSVSDTAPPSSAKVMRLITSAPCALCGFNEVSTANTAPLFKSRSCTTSVVVPRSMAMPVPSAGSNAPWPERPPPG